MSTGDRLKRATRMRCISDPFVRSRLCFMGLPAERSAFFFYDPQVETPLKATRMLRETVNFLTSENS